jgi:hypothetical protein
VKNNQFRATGVHISDLQKWQSTSLFLPAWWARAYDVAVQNDSGDYGAMEVAARSGVAPAMDMVELNAVAMLLQNFQSQILKSGVQVLTINSKEHQKHAGTNTKSRKFVFEKAVQMLGDIRLLRRTEHSKDIEFSRLFAGETWERPGAGQHYLIKMTPARLGPEIIFGVSDPHIDLARAMLGEPEGKFVTGETAPLSLWRSAWLDLQGVEQGVYLRMEMAMQWFRNLLQIDGIWGCTFTELISGFKLPTPRSMQGHSDTEKILRLIDKLGKKLRQHGLLSTMDEDQYLAFDMASDHSTLAWQVSNERHLDAPRTALMKEIAGWMESDRATDFVPSLARICLPRTVSADRMNKAQQLWTATKKATISRQYYPGLENASAQPILPSLLFFELCLRAGEKDGFAIPQEFFAGPLKDIVNSAESSAGEAFGHFCEFLSDTYDFTNAVRSVPYVSLAARVTREMKEFSYKLKDLAKPFPQESVIVSVDEEQKVEAEQQFASNQIRKVAGGSSENDAPKKSQISQALATRMLKTASEELSRMRGTYPDRYQQLKKSYITSLDESSRSLFLDFQRRMQPSVFEDHIKQKLIKYMVDNPGSWGM